MSETLNVPISEKTRRKLGALAILTGKKFGSMEQELAELLDGVLSVRIDEALAEIDGRPTHQEEMNTASSNYTVSFPVEKPRPRPKVDAETSDDVAEDLSGHSLSDDEDFGTPDLAEQLAEAVGDPKPKKREALTQTSQTDEFVVPDINAPDSGGDVESFLEGMEATSPTMRAASARPNRATSKLNSGKPRFKISDYGDEESGDLF